jgi:hypothetical protein
MAEDYKPWTRETPESDESIKRSMVPRQDAYEQVSGQVVYTRDVCLPSGQEGSRQTGEAVV